MRASLAAVALLALAACAPQGGRSRAFAPYAPLRAHITSPSVGGAPLFHVNRPAYVAMFYIIPGGGVSMLYPGFGSGSMDGRVFAGSHFARGRAGMRDQFSFVSAGMAGSPRFYFLIASDRPLNVRQFGGLGTALMSRLGTAYNSFSAYSTMERLARLALPSVADDGSWTTDMYVEWPNVIGNEPERGRVLMECAGYVMYVPVAYVRAVQAMVCDAREEAEKEAAEEEREPVVRPRAREPIPADPQGGETEEIRTMDPKALVERISSSTQLTEPVTRRPVSGGRDELGRARPGGYGSSSTGRGSVGSPSSRPPATSSGGSSSAGAPSGGSGPVSAPASRPSSDGGSGSSGGGGGGGSGPVTAPTSRAD